MRIASPQSLLTTGARAGLQGRVLLLDSPERFSFTYGALTPHVAVSRGLLEGLSAEEIRAVLEHERYHVRNLDPRRAGRPSAAQPHPGDRLLSRLQHERRPRHVVYPDSGKVGAFERLPHGGGMRASFRSSDAVDYHDGEQPPA